MIDRSTKEELPTDARATPVSSGEWSDIHASGPMPFWEYLRDDVVAHVPPGQRNRSASSWGWMAAKIALTSPGFKVTLLYRVNNQMVNRAGLAGKVAAGIIARATHVIFHSALAPTARLHGGLILPHPQGIVVGSGVVVGPRAWIFQNVTMGGTEGKSGEPRVGADCRIHAGAVIGGPVKLGDEVVVSPNSLVQRSIPRCSLAVGVPANVFPKFGKPKA